MNERACRPNELPDLPHAELQRLFDAHAQLGNPCPACRDSIPGALVPAGNDDNHLFVQSCDACAGGGHLAPGVSDDLWAVHLIADRIGWNVHVRYDDHRQRYWRPFIAKPGGWDDCDFIAVDADGFGWAPRAEIALHPSQPTTVDPTPPQRP